MSVEHLFTSLYFINHQKGGPMKLIIFTLLTLFFIQSQAYAGKCTTNTPKTCINYDPIRDTVRDKI